MIYPVDLRQAGLALGCFLVVAHVVALWRPALVKAALRDLPRSRAAGVVLLGVAAAWTFFLVRTMDLGEFAGLRIPMLGFIVAGAVLMAVYVPEFLAVRALGMLALLAAEPLLGAAFLRPEVSRLLVVALAYVWIIVGLFWVGMPFLLRDQVRWLVTEPARYAVAAWAGAVYGAVILALALLVW